MQHTPPPFGSNGVKPGKIGCMSCRAVLIISGLLRQVGQESNVQPAVLEPAAVGSGVVQKAALRLGRRGRDRRVLRGAQVPEATPDTAALSCAAAC